MRRGRKVFLAAAALATGWTLLRDWRARDRGLAVVLDAGQVRALCRAAGYPEEDFWERARLMGVFGAGLRSERLEAYISSARVIRFTGAEIKKMRAAGLAGKAAPLSANSVWVREEALARRMQSCARRAAVAASFRRYSGMHIVDLPADLRPEDFPMGYDPSTAGMILSKGLVPVYWVAGPADLWLEEPEGYPGPVVFLAPSGTRLADGARLALLRDRLNRRGVWLGFTGGGPSPAGIFLARTLLAGELDPRAGLAGAMRSVMHKGERIVAARLDPDRGVEENLAAVRALLRGMRSGGFHQGLPPVERDIRVLSMSEMAVRYGLAMLLAVLGPIAAVRGGLGSLRAMQGAGSWPEASPVREVCLGTAAAAAASAAAGLGAYALLAVPQWRLGLFPAGWSAWAAGLPLLIGFLALYVPDLSDWAVFLRKPAAYGRGLGVLLAAGAACLLFAAPRCLENGALEWWLACRWREFAVGYPCLAAGLWTYFWRRDPAHSAGWSSGDPRPWLLLGVFGPIGTIEAFARALVPFEAALGHTASGLFLGCAGGLGLVALRRLARRTPIL